MPAFSLEVEMALMQGDVAIQADEEIVVEDRGDGDGGWRDLRGGL